MFKHSCWATPSYQDTVTVLPHIYGLKFQLSALLMPQILNFAYDMHRTSRSEDTLLHKT